MTTGGHSEVDRTGSGGEGSTVTVVWSLGTGPELTGRLLREAVRPRDRDRGELRLTHHCSACGSTEHGRPVLSAESGDGPFVSISRAGPVTVVAACGAGPVGVDVEADGAADFAGFDRVALHPGEQPTTNRTVVWVRKESVLKATGHGLRVEPSRLRVSGPDQPAALLAWDGPGAPSVAWMYDVRTAPGHVAAVTVLAQRRPALVVKAARAARASTTTR